MRRSLMTLIFTTMFMPVSPILAEGLRLEPYSFDLPDLGEPVYLAQADTEPAGEEAARTEQCLAFAKDIHADLGEVLRAGCEPTLAQMSALMDNPLGNVAMFFNQFDYYRMENSEFNENEGQGGVYRYLAVSETTHRQLEPDQPGDLHRTQRAAGPGQDR